MNIPLISIIVPTYNRCNTLGCAVCSILEQKTACTEVIIVDDGSTDETGAIVNKLLNKYGCDRIKYIAKPNGGCASARNAGLRAAQGKYIGFLDSDDEYIDGGLQVLSNTLEEKRCDFAFGGWFFEENGTRSEYIVPVGAYSPDSLSVDHFLNGNFSLCSTLWRRECLHTAGGFDEDMRWNEDSDFVQRLLCQGYKGKYIDRPVFVWKVHSGGKSRDRTGIRMAQIKSAEKIVASYPAFREQLGLERYNEKMSSLWWQLGDSYMTQNNMNKALDAWRMSSRFRRPSLYRRIRMKFLQFLGIDLSPVANAVASVIRYRSMLTPLDHHK